MASQDDPEESLGIKKAAHMLGVSEVSLRRWEKNGILVPLRTAGGHRRYPFVMLVEFKEQKMAGEFRRKGFCHNKDHERQMAFEFESYRKDE